MNEKRQREQPATPPVPPAPERHQPVQRDDVSDAEHQHRHHLHRQAELALADRQPEQEHRTQRYQPGSEAPDAGDELYADRGAPSRAHGRPPSPSVTAYRLCSIDRITTPTELNATPGSVVGSDSLLVLVLGLPLLALFALLAFFLVLYFLHAEDLLAFLLFELLLDVLLILPKFREQLELQGVHPSLRLLYLVEHLLHRRLHLGGENDRLKQFLVGLRGLVDPGAGPENAVAAFVDRLAHAGGLDLRNDHTHDVLRLGGDLGMVLQGCGGASHRNVALHRPRHVDRLLGLLVVRLHLRAHVLSLVEDVHELEDEPVTLLFQRVVAPLRELDAVLDLHQVLTGWFDIVAGHYRVSCPERVNSVRPVRPRTRRRGSVQSSAWTRCSFSS